MKPVNKIEIDHLTFTYPGAEEPTLKDLSLTVEDGDFLAVVGNNGCGKSTLCKTLNGLIPHFIVGDMEGMVKIDGVDTREQEIGSLAKKAGYVYQDFENRLAKEAQTMQSIESDFTQVKYLDILDEKVTSKGKFYYQKSGKIRMEYAQPVNYLIVINDSRLKIVSDGKKSVMSLTANKMMNQMQDMLTACMIGDLSKMSSDYKLEYFENDSYYIVKIKPVNKAIQTYISEIEIYLDKKDMSVYKLRLSETATNYTEYEFYNKRFNALKDETKFSIR